MTDNNNEVGELKERLKNLEDRLSRGSGKQRDYLLPATILIAGLLIGGFIYMGQKNAPQGGSGAPAAPEPPDAETLDKVMPVTADDHIRGSINASVKIIEFSDFECPFCKRFHPTLQQIVEEYEGRVAWIYRHFPIDALHSKASKEAEASECVAELGGNDAFWAYTDKIYEITPSNNRLDITLLPDFAEEIGLDRTAFEDCLESGRHAEKVADDLEDAQNSGGRGTPWSIVIAPDGTKTAINGAFPYTEVKKIVEEILK